MQEPATTAAYIQALNDLGYELDEIDVDIFQVVRRETGSTTHLEADNLDDAAFEAWHLVRE